MSFLVVTITDTTLVTNHVSSKAQIVGRPIQADPGSEESILMIQDWIRECNESHSKCHRPTKTMLPSRVIDVGSSDGLSEPRLVISNGRFGQYIALTHVWGGLVPVRTIKGNLAQHLFQLPLSSLPPNFRDAVIITRKLGLQYLWIDALCIIQDSTEDWEIECTRMGNIYRNSALTIAAVDAENSNVGFLNERPRLISNSQSCKLPCIGSWGGANIEAIQRDPLEFLDKNSPLTFRAWCIQEKLLCPRILYFGTKQTYWDCNTLSHLEAYGNAPPNNELYSGLDFGKAGYTQMVDQLRTKTTYGSDRVWIRFVHEYSSRNLTKLEDKLPALSGLASDFQKITGFTYLAGVWKEDLHQDLIWVVEQPQCKPKLPPGETVLPYIAPSWSWASHIGPVNFIGPITDMDAQVVAADITLAGLDPFGRVTSGYLRIRGRAKCATLKYQRKSGIPDITYISHEQSLYDPRTELEIGRCSLDYVEYSVSASPSSCSNSIDIPEREVFCFALSRHAMNPTIFRSTIMVLERVVTAMPLKDEASEWRRIGMGYIQYHTSNEAFRGADWFADVQDREMCII